MQATDVDRERNGEGESVKSPPGVGDEVLVGRSETVAVERKRESVGAVERERESVGAVERERESVGAERERESVGAVRERVNQVMEGQKDELRQLLHQRSRGTWLSRKCPASTVNSRVPLGLWASVWAAHKPWLAKEDGYDHWCQLGVSGGRVLVEMRHRWMHGSSTCGVFDTN